MIAETTLSTRTKDTTRSRRGRQQAYVQNYHYLTESFDHDRLDAYQISSVPRLSCIADPSYRLISEAMEVCSPRACREEAFCWSTEKLFSQDCEETEDEDPRIEMLPTAPPSAAMHKGSQGGLALTHILNRLSSLPVRWQKVAGPVFLCRALRLDDNTRRLLGIITMGYAVFILRPRHTSNRSCRFDFRVDHCRCGYVMCHARVWGVGH